MTNVIASKNGNTRKVNMNTHVIKMNGFTINFHTKENNFQITGPNENRNFAFFILSCLIGSHENKNLAPILNRKLLDMTEHHVLLKKYAPSFDIDPCVASPKVTSTTRIALDRAEAIGTTLGLTTSKEGKTATFSLPGGSKFFFITLPNLAPSQRMGATAALLLQP